MDAAAQPVSKAPPARPRRRLWRFSLRTLLAVVTLVALVLGVWVSRAERQRQAVAAIQAAGGIVRYDYQAGEAPAVYGERPGPDWLCRLLGVDYFADVTLVGLYPSATDETVAHLSGLTSLTCLYLDDTQVGDAGLAHLSGLTNLRVLWLHNTGVGDASLICLSGMSNLQELSLPGTQVSDAGLAHLSRALPHCLIDH
jgi:hypothetical protein